MLVENGSDQGSSLFRTRSDQALKCFRMTEKNRRRRSGNQSRRCAYFRALTYLIIPGPNSRGGSISLPISSFAFDILNTAAVIAMVMKSVLSASSFPGHILTGVSHQFPSLVRSMLDNSPTTETECQRSRIQFWFVSEKSLGLER